MHKIDDAQHHYTAKVKITIEFSLLDIMHWHEDVKSLSKCMTLEFSPPNIKNVCPMPLSFWERFFFFFSFLVCFTFMDSAILLIRTMSCLTFNGLLILSFLINKWVVIMAVGWYNRVSIHLLFMHSCLSSAPKN